jgi:hypothetical protein
MAVTRARWLLAKMPEEFQRGLSMAAGSLWQRTSESGHSALALLESDRRGLEALLYAARCDPVRCTRPRRSAGLLICLLFDVVCPYERLLFQGRGSDADCFITGRQELSVFSASLRFTTVIAEIRPLIAVLRVPNRRSLRVVL